MAKRTGPTNMQLKKLILELRKLSAKEKASIWKRVANDLEKSTRSRREVSFSKIEKHVKDKETVVVPGKVLASGILTRKITLAAWKFSAQAKEKAKGAKLITIQELMKMNPKGKGVRLMG